MENPHDRIMEMRLSGDPAERTVAAIWADVTDRRGWRQQVDDFDDEVMHEILDAWLVIVRLGMQP